MFPLAILYAFSVIYAMEFEVLELDSNAWRMMSM
jgi:hypothetical protein